MSIAIVPLTKGKYTWLSSVAGEVATIFGDYWEHEFGLDQEQRATVAEFDEYLRAVKKGLDYGAGLQSCLDFDKSTIEGLKAKEVLLMADSEIRINTFFNELTTALNQVRNQAPVDRDLLWELHEHLLRLAELASRESYHPESSHVL